MEISRELIEFFFGGLLVVFVSAHFYYSLERRKNITLIDISVWITGISFGLAPFILVLSNGYFPKAKSIDVMFSYVGIFLFIIGLLLIKKMFYKQIKETNNLQILLKEVNKINPRGVFFFYAAFFIIRLIFAFDYGIFGSGSATSERMTSLPYLLFVSRSLLDLTFFGILLWSLTKILYNKKIFLLPSIIITIEAILIFFNGRRQMLYLVFLFLYIYILLGYRINLKILIPSILIIIILVNVIFPAFIAFREIALRTNSTGDIIQDYKTSYNLLSETGVDKESSETNVAQRVYINNWNINILSKTSLAEGLNGKALAMCILWVVPRPLLPFKGTLKDPELLISYTYGLSLKDSPSNWPAYGFADFGFIGGMIYGIILGLILFLFQKFAIYNFNRYPFYSFVIIGSVSFLAFFVEETPIGIFSVIRDTIILFVVFYLLRVLSFKKIKIRAQLQKG
jgi:hypothetical protein